ncbi:MAG: mechanosensitive ion channel family protein [Candidatus Tectomicrobia bacterium]|nr:mechanosensitive ion channel family protein [Candidatus Tectomicrobia bacterium]
MPGLSIQMLGLVNLVASAGFWSELSAEFARQGALWLTVAVLLASGLLLRLAPHQMKRIRATLLLFGLYIVCLSVAAWLRSLGLTSEADDVVLIGEVFRYISFISLSSLFLFDVLMPIIHLSMPPIMRDTLVLLAYAIMALWLLSSYGVHISTVLTTSAILTAVIGLSLQDTLGNLMAGIVLQIEHIVQVGDWVKIDQHIGRVKEIRWRQTSIETRNWDTVIIPNSQLMKDQVIVYGRRENAPLQSRRWIYFNVDFRYVPSEVIARVNEALQSAPIEHVAAHPPIHAILWDFKESYCQYAARYWLTDLAVDDPTDSIVRIRIYYALKRAGIPLSIPAQSLFVTEEKRKRQERKEEREVEHKLQALRRVELFHMINEEELRHLARHLRYAPFSRGEVLIRQGAEAHSLYIITTGQVSVITTLDGTPRDNIPEREVAQLGPGDFFGEMALMTGEPRSATVVALEDVECYRLDREGFQGILMARPEIAEDISHILAHRRVELDAVRAGLDIEAHRDHTGAAQHHILDLIRQFFKI